ncbi:MAG: efflux RND transporter permease subunit [Burkholderiales bacterium]|nr:efflux RND transporter permease subunit [Opitutaceae bacterium]
MIIIKSKREICFSERRQAKLAGPKTASPVGIAPGAALRRVRANGAIRRFHRRHLPPVLHHHRLRDGSFGARRDDVYFQISLPTIAGLSAKSALLIVEFVKEGCDRGMSLVDAAFHAARQPLRPILMTSLAFGPDALPLAIAIDGRTRRKLRLHPSALICAFCG